MGWTEKLMRRQIHERGRGKNTEGGLEPMAMEGLDSLSVFSRSWL